MKCNTFQVEYNFNQFYLQKVLQVMNKFIQLSYHERRQIYSGICSGASQREIAKKLDRSPSTISREIRRNCDKSGYLYAGEAHEKAQKRKHINKPKINKDAALKEYIIEGLLKHWSPLSIAARWKMETGKSISKEAIYQWIYSVNGESLKLKRLLVRRRKKRGMNRKIKKQKIKNRVSIHNRPKNINERVEMGHFEGDLIFNKGSQSQNILTLVERVSRAAILVKNDNKKSETVIDALINKIKTLNILILSITFDNGTEFADHHKLNELGIKTYFCDPGAPWQKGSIENVNGVLRRYIPFDMPASEISDNFVNEVNVKINNIPREILGYKTAAEVFMESRVKIAWPANEA